MKLLKRILIALCFALVLSVGAYADDGIDITTEAGGSSSSPASTVTISPTGGDYTTIQAALTANATADFLFIVYPGTYANDTINFTANNQCVIGAGCSPKGSLVTNTTGIVDFGAFTGCTIENVKMVMTLAANAVDSTVTGTGGCNFKFCHIECVASGTNSDTSGGATALRGVGDFKIVEGSIIYTNTANRAARGKQAILIEAGSTWVVDDVQITVTGSGTSSAHAAIRDNSTGAMLIDKCTIEVTDNATDKAYGLSVDAGTGTPEVEFNSIHVSNTGGDATVVRVGSTSSLSVRSRYNHFHAEADAGHKAYALEIDDANTTATSQFDDLIAVDGVLIASGGTYTKLNSPEDGALAASEDITGKVDVVLDSTATYDILAKSHYGGVVVNSDADAIEMDLDAAVVGMSMLVLSNAAGAITLDPNGTDTLVYEGTAAAAGEALISSGAKGDSLSIVCLVANQWLVIGHDVNGWTEASP